jgi:hypothetical protein
LRTLFVNLCFDVAPEKKIAGCQIWRTRQPPDIFYELLNNKGSLFSRPPWCTLKTARTPLFDDALPTTLRAHRPKLCFSQIGAFFLPHPVQCWKTMVIYKFPYFEPFSIYNMSNMFTYANSSIGFLQTHF